MKTIALVALFILCLITLQPVAAQQANVHSKAVTVKPRALTESEKIELLIDCIRSMKGATFIRNGSEHTCQEAAQHLQAKWEKHSSKIKSAQDFITHLATKSSTSGELYKIRFPDGKEKPTATVLHEALKQLK